MNKLEQIHSLLTELQTGVQAKVNKERIDFEKMNDPETKIILQFSEGQLYEINYILAKFWDIANKDYD